MVTVTPCLGLTLKVILLALRFFRSVTSPTSGSMYFFDDVTVALRILEFYRFQIIDEEPDESPAQDKQDSIFPGGNDFQNTLGVRHLI